MTKVKYEFEWADVRALVTIANVVLIIIVGLGISWMGLGIAAYDLIQDIRKKSHINLILIHLSMLILNSYFLMLFYNLL